MGQSILVCIGMDFIHHLNYVRLVMVPLRRDSGYYWFALVIANKLDFDALADIMG